MKRRRHGTAPVSQVMGKRQGCLWGWFLVSHISNWLRKTESVGPCRPQDTTAQAGEDPVNRVAGCAHSWTAGMSQEGNTLLLTAAMGGNLGAGPPKGKTDQAVTVLSGFKKLKEGKEKEKEPVPICQRKISNEIIILW